MGETWRGVVERLGERCMSRLDPPGSCCSDLDTYIDCVLAG